jgi:transcriptional regulator with XRE-family HTH domain
MPMPTTVKSASSVDRHVGARVRMQRMMLGMSQTDLGQRAGGITFQQIQKYENGVNRIGASRLHLISRALNVPIEFFYEGVPEEGGTGRGKSAAAAVPDVSTFLATSDAVDLMKAFVQIKDRGVRRRIVKLAEELAKGEAPEKASAKATAAKGMASKGAASKATAQRKR